MKKGNNSILEPCFERIIMLASQPMNKIIVLTVIFCLMSFFASAMSVCHADSSPCTEISAVQDDVQLNVVSFDKGLPADGDVADCGSCLLCSSCRHLNLSSKGTSLNTALLIVFTPTWSLDTFNYSSLLNSSFRPPIAA